MSVLTSRMVMGEVEKLLKFSWACLGLETRINNFRWKNHFKFYSTIRKPSPPPLSAKWPQSHVAYSSLFHKIKFIFPTPPHYWVYNIMYCSPFFRYNVQLIRSIFTDYTLSRTFFADSSKSILLPAYRFNFRSFRKRHLTIGQNIHGYFRNNLYLRANIQHNMTALTII